MVRASAKKGSELREGAGQQEECDEKNNDILGSADASYISLADHVGHPPHKHLGRLALLDIDLDARRP